jgi:DNA-binding CsgD family transcriptional regulator
VSASALLEREAELETLGRALDSARAGAGRLLIVDGHAGLGKSQLVAAARGFAKGTGVRVLVAGATELEQDFAFGLALQLFEPLLSDPDGPSRELLLSGAAGLAIPLFERAEPAGGGGGDEDIFPLLHGLYWLVSNLTEHGPALIAVDDAHWADAPSLRFLLYLAQRLGELPVAVVVARRPAEPGPEDGLLAKLAGHPAAEPVVLSPLSEQSVERLVRAFYVGDVTAEFSAACAEVTRGNPLFLQQLLASLETDEVEPDDAGARRVREMGPEAVSRSVLLRLSNLQFGATSLARAVAVLGAGAPLRRAAALAKLDLAVAGEAADALAATEILSPGEPLAFVHPIVRAAIYAELPAAERARLHANAAALLRDEAAPPELIAPHLLAGEPGGEEWVVDTLQVAADRAMSAGAPGSAVRSLERALAEPPARERRPAVLVDLGRAAAAAGDPRAVDHLEGALVAVTEPERRAQISWAIGRTLMAGGRHKEAAETFDRGLRELEGADPEVGLRLEAAYASAARRSITTLPLAVARLRPMLSRRLAGATPGERAMLAHVAYERALSGADRDDVVEAATAALAAGRLLEEDTADGVFIYHAIEALAWADELEAAESALAGAVADARRRGSVFGYATACYTRAQVRLLAGRVDDALSDAEAALERAEDGWRAALPAAHAVAARSRVERGELEQAAEALELPGGDESWEASTALSWLFEGRGWLAMAQGDYAAAAKAFGECRRRQAWIQAPNPAVMAWRSGSALAASALGQDERADMLAHQELELARAFGAPRAIGVALRTAGLLAGGERGLHLLAESVETLAESPARLELARARTELGAALRRAGRRQAAQEELRLGLDLAHRLGATALAERARDELSAAGARPRRPQLSGIEALTASERRVAELAAAGSTNREIAQALFVTVKTVEWHLRNTYLKLGIASRRELTGAMEAEGEPKAA